MKPKAALVDLSVVAAAIMLGTIFQLALADVPMPPHGRLQGTVKDVYTSQPMAGAVITVTSVNGQAFSLTTDASGQYLIDLDQSLSPLNVTASAHNHRSVSMLAVIRETEVCIRDFDLLFIPEPAPEVPWSTLLVSAVLVIIFFSYFAFGVRTSGLQR